MTRPMIPILLSICLLAACATDSTDPTGPDPVTDTTAPTVLSVTPVDGESGVDIYSQIMVTFSEDMNQMSAEGNINIDGTTVDFFTWLDNTTVTLDTAELPEATEVTVTIGSGLSDIAGNGMTSPYQWSFRTESSIPFLLQSSPTDGDGDITRTAHVELEFSNFMDLTSLTNATTIESTPLAKTAVDFSYDSGDGTWVEINFTDPLPSMNDITINISTDAMDLNGIRLEQAISITFTTNDMLDLTLPTLVSIVPEDGSIVPASTSEIVVTFSEAIDFESLNPSMLSALFGFLFEQSGAEPFLSPDGTQVTIPLPTPLPAGMPLIAHFDSYSDLAGNEQTTPISYRIDVEGDVDPWPMANGTRFAYEGVETETPPGGSPFQYNITDYYQIDEQLSGDLHWARYDSDLYNTSNEHMIFRRTADTLSLAGSYFNEGGELEEESMSPNIVFAKFPPFVGQTWSGASVISTLDGNFDVDYTITVTGREDVTAAFSDDDTELIWHDCWVYSRTFTLSQNGVAAGSGAEIDWIAPGVGRVRGEETYDEDGTLFHQVEDVMWLQLP